MDLTTEYSTWFVLLCLLLGVVVAWVLYARSRERYEWSQPLVWLLAIFRAVSIAFIAFFLLGPLIRYMQQEVQKPIIVIAHDGSASIVSAADSAAVRSHLVKNLGQIEQRLGSDYEVRTFTYGERVVEGIRSDQDNKQTDLGELFKEVEDRYDGLNLGAIILDGDGIYNRGRDPLLVAQNIGVPIYTVALGDTTVRKDLVLSDVDHNRITYKGNEFPIIVRYKADHLTGERTAAVVYEEGKELARKEIFLSGDPAVGEVAILVKAEKAGIRRYRVQLEEVAGEVNPANNATVIYIEVLDDRQKVLVLAAAPHPDVRAIADALSTNENYEVVRSLATDPGVKPEEYDLVILHQLPSASMPANLLANTLKKKVPMWYVVGMGTDLARLEKMPGGIRITGANQTTNDVQGYIDHEFSSFKLDRTEASAIARFPPLQVPFGEHRSKNAFSSLLNQRVGAVETEDPLLSLGEEDGTRYATLHGEGIWRWRIYDHVQNRSHDLTDKLIGKVAQYLAVKEDKSKFRVQTAQRFDENERVIFTAELYNDNYEAINGPEVGVRITDENGDETPFTFSRTGDNYRLDAGTLPSGSYRYTAGVELNGNSLSVNGEFTVSSLLAERVNLVADHNLLQAMSERSGGMMVGLDDISGIGDAIRQRKQVVARSVSRVSLNDLIELKWLFFVLLAFLTLEWAMRRRNGAY
jgi:hypothetical protein